MNRCAATTPRHANDVTGAELKWLSKIIHTGNIANFLPLLVAARVGLVATMFTEDNYIALLQALECYAYRVFLFAARRSNAGRTHFYRWGYQLFNKDLNIEEIIKRVGVRLTVVKPQT